MSLLMTISELRKRIVSVACNSIFTLRLLETVKLANKIDERRRDRLACGLTNQVAINECICKLIVSRKIH